MQLSMRQRLEKVRATSAQMNEVQLRQALDEASKQDADRLRHFNELFDEYAGLETELSRYKADLQETKDELRGKNFQLQSLMDGLSPASDGNVSSFNPEPLLKLVALKEEPSPLKCIEIINQFYGDRCTVSG